MKGLNSDFDGFGVRITRSNRYLADRTAEGKDNGRSDDSKDHNRKQEFKHGETTLKLFEARRYFRFTEVLGHCRHHPLRPCILLVSNS